MITQETRFRRDVNISFKLYFIVQGSFNHWSQSFRGSIYGNKPSLLWSSGMPRVLLRWRKKPRRQPIKWFSQPGLHDLSLFFFFLLLFPLHLNSPFFLQSDSSPIILRRRIISPQGRSRSITFLVVSLIH